MSSRSRAVEREGSVGGEEAWRPPGVPVDVGLCWPGGETVGGG